MLISHHEFVEELKRAVPSNMFTRVNMLPERVPDKYPNQEAVAERFNLSRQLVGFLIAHCEVVDQLISDMPPNIVARATIQ